MRRIVLSGLVAVAAVLGGVAVPAIATAQPTAVVRPDSAAVARPDSLVALRAARPDAGAYVGAVESDEPLISCVLATDCLGIEGASNLSEGGASKPTHVARWNGSSWRGVAVALPKATKSDDLYGVSCKGAKSCLVVGDYYTSTSQSAASRMLALSYNGTSLKPTPTVPLPKGTTDAALLSVSCTTTRYCVALGAADGNAGLFGDVGSIIIIETWNGAKWTLHTAAASIGSTTAVEPTVVSCATSAFCVLAGTELTETSSSGSAKLYAASWNGRKLTAMKPATVGSSKDYPFATDVSCATVSNCAVSGAEVGDSTGSATPSLSGFTEIWNGKTWQLAKVTWPKGTGESFTFGASCYAAHSCEAVGLHGASTAATSPFEPAAVSFNGTAGVLQAVPAPPKGDSATFADVSCLPWGACVATGETGKSSGSSGAVMTGVWNGKAWKLYPGF